MLYLILYITAFLVTTIIYVILYGSKRREFPFFGEKFHELPTYYIRSLKIIPSLIAVFFVIFTAPRYDYFYILVIMAFIFTFLGDIGIIIKNLLGLAIYLFTHIFFSIAYITQLIQFSIKPIGTYSIISVGIILYITVISLLFRFLKVNLKEKYNRTTIIILSVFFYLAILSIHIITAAILVLNYYITSKGIIVIIFGAVLYLVSDISIFIREASEKQKYSVLLITLTYYLALFCLSLITQFY
jgi:hypothetical protein